MTGPAARNRARHKIVLPQSGRRVTFEDGDQAHRFYRDHEADRPEYYLRRSSDVEYVRYAKTLYLVEVKCERFSYGPQKQYAWATELPRRHAWLEDALQCASDQLALDSVIAARIRDHDTGRVVRVMRS